MSERRNLFYRLELQFCGTKYCGWQIQPRERTVQGELNLALETIFKSKEIKTIGSGRTDTGVHSLCHIVRLEAPSDLDPIALLKGLNSLLPKDILVTHATYTDNNFLPTNDAKSREYFYLFSNQTYPNVMTLSMMANVNYNLNLELMAEACSAFKGTYDFKSFMCAGSEVSSTVRTVFSCEISYHEGTFHNIVSPHFKISISANGFLKQMVRCIVGTIWDVGRGKISVSNLKQELLSPSGKNIAPVAPAMGLFKANVTY